MRNKKIFVLKIVWRKSIASLHRLTQAVQRANLRRTAGDPTWVKVMITKETFVYYVNHKKKGGGGSQKSQVMPNAYGWWQGEGGGQKKPKTCLSLFLFNRGGI